MNPTDANLLRLSAEFSSWASELADVANPEHPAKLVGTSVYLDWGDAGHMHSKLNNAVTVDSSDLDSLANDVLSLAHEFERMRDALGSIMGEMDGARHDAVDLFKSIEQLTE